MPRILTCHGKCGYSGIGPTSMHLHYMENPTHRPPYWEKVHSVKSKVSRYKHSHLSVVGSKVNNVKALAQKRETTTNPLDQAIELLESQLDTLKKAQACITELNLRKVG